MTSQNNLWVSQLSSLNATVLLLTSWVLPNVIVAHQIDISVPNVSVPVVLVLSISMRLTVTELKQCICRY